MYPRLASASALSLAAWCAVVLVPAKMSASVACPLIQVYAMVWGPRSRMRSCSSCHKSPSLVREWWLERLAMMSEMIPHARRLRSRESVATCVMIGALVAMMAATSSARVDEGFWPRSGPHSCSAGRWLSIMGSLNANWFSHLAGGVCLRGHQTPNEARDHWGVRGRELPQSE